MQAPPPFRLWRIDLSVDPAPAVEAGLDALEMARAGRFVFPRHARRYRVSHAALRALLADGLGIAPGEVVFELGAHGKPSLAVAAHGGAALSFNMSHSDDVALVATVAQAAADIGVDVELLRDMPDAVALAQRHFTPSECAEMAAAAALGEAARNLGFLRGWTRKEACLKAIGSGLSLAPHTFDAGLAPEHRIVPIDTPQGQRRVAVWSLPDDGDIVAALARVV